jgi:hypothetical protein
MIRALFADFAPHNAAIVGALAVSILWMFVVVWLLDLLDAERRRVSAWQGEARWLLDRTKARNARRLTS